jgi:phenylacetate-CoA ligase
MLNRMRYGTEFRRFLDFLENSQYWSEDQIKAYRRRTLCELLTHCARWVPYYRSQFKSLGLREVHFDTDDILTRLPILEKHTVRDRRHEFFAECVPYWRTIAKGTAGTTGSPMVFHATRTEIQRYWAYTERARAWVGSRLGLRRATFSTLAPIAPGRNKPPFWRRDRSENKALLSIYHLSPRTIRYYADFLDRFQPQEILGHPSCLALLASLWPKDREPAFRPRAIITTGETLYDFQRLRVEGVFGCRVTDWYSAGGEMGPVVTMCGQGSYHEHPESGIIEVLDRHLNPVLPGETGEIVISGFSNWTMPLLRYRVGDHATPSTEVCCACGRHFALYERIEGKRSDQLFLPDGRILGNLFSLVEGFPHVMECQFHQYATDRVDLIIVPDRKFTEADRRHIHNRLQGFLGVDVHLSIQTRPEIARTGRGKYRLVVSHLQHRSP